MSNAIESLKPFHHESAEFEPEPPARLRIRGQIAIQEPTKVFQPYLQSVHEAAIAAGVAEFEVDVTALSFVNSSAIRLFIDWATWVSEGGRPYLLVFRTQKTSTWQRAAFGAIRALSGDAVRIETGAP
jgi:hypothetical protein